MSAPKQRAEDLLKKHGHDAAVKHCKQVLYMCNTRNTITKGIIYELILDHLTTMRDSELM